MTGTIEIWEYFSIACFCAAAVFLVVAVAMFFVFDVRKIRKELSGKHVESYMEEYRRKKEENKRVGIYDPSGKLISNVKNTAVSKGVNYPKTQNPAQRNDAAGVSMAEAMASSRASASVKSENATQVLVNNNNKYKNFVIIKDFMFCETSEYIG